MTRLALIALFLATGAQAQQPVPTVPPVDQQGCGTRDQVTAKLTKGFAENRLFQGLGENGNLYEIWGNPETGTWTWVMTLPNGRACMAVGGLPFNRIPYVFPGDPV